MLKFRHKKRGTEYTVEAVFSVNVPECFEGDDFVFRDSEVGICYAKVQSSNPLGTRGQPIVVYYGSDGYFWARAQDEFSDGRFELIS